MTEDEIKDIVSKGSDELKPMIKEMTRLLMEAYQKGISVGLELGSMVIIKEN